MTATQRTATIAMMDAILACSCADPVMRARAALLKQKLGVSDWLADLFGALRR